MPPFRRRTLLAGAWTAPVLACAALATPAEAEDAELDALGQKRPYAQPAAACPFCRPGQPCPEHLL